MALALVLLWGAAWAANWQAWLAAWPWPRVLAAWLLFVLPGVWLARWLDDAAGFVLSRHLSAGFAIALGITGLLGTLSRVTHLPYGVIRLLFFGAGAVALAGFVLSRRTPLPRKPGRLLSGALPALAAAALAVTVGLGRVSSADDYSTTVFVTAFVQSAGSNFEDPVFGTGHPLAPRFWLSFWPLAQALIASKARVSGIEINNVYLTPFLLIWSLLGVFSLARALGWSRRLATLAVVSQVVSLVLLLGRDQVGDAFFERIVQDKVLAAAVISPPFFALLARFLSAPGWRRLLLLLLAGLGLAFTHGTMLGIAVLMAAAQGLLDGAVRRNATGLLFLAVLLVVLTLPQLALRLVDHAMNRRLQYSVTAARESGALSPMRERRLRVLADQRFYGVAPELVWGLSFAGVAAAAVLALAAARESVAARYLIASASVIAAGVFPYTGWLLGLLLTPFHLWRLTWFTPFGIAWAFLIGAGLKLLERRGARGRRLSRWRTVEAVAVVYCLLFATAAVALVAAYEKNPLPLSLHDPPDWQRLAYVRGVNYSRPGCRPRYADLREVGRRLDAVIAGEAVVVGDRYVNDFIPSMSAKAKLLAYRVTKERLNKQTVYHGSFEAQAAERRVADWRGVTTSGPAEERLAILERYRVRFLLQCGGTGWAEALRQQRPDRIVALYRAGNLHLYGVQLNQAG